MRKFKHKITGNIAVETISEKNYKVSEPKNFTVPKWIVENSNDWEEIVEKDYEILMYRSKINTDIYFDNPEYFSRLSSDWEIYSIRRKSDGVEFKIGDKVYWNWQYSSQKYYTIDKFFIREDDNSVGFYTKESCRYYWVFSKIQHYKEPILITEDDYECTLDDRVFGVLPKANWQTNFYGNEGISVGNLVNSGDGNCTKNIAWLYFKTKENAEKYIYENKPEFSRKQVKDAIDNSKFCSILNIGNTLHEDILEKELGL